METAQASGVDSIISGYASQMIEAANQDVKEKLRKAQAELEALHTERQEHRATLKKYSKIIKTIEELEGTDDKKPVEFIWRSDDQVFLQILDEIATMLGKNYNVGAFQGISRNERVRAMINYCLKFVIEDARDLFINHAAHGYYGR